MSHTPSGTDYRRPAIISAVELDELATWTVIQRWDGKIAQKWPIGWFEVGCSDPFDAASLREWDGSHIISEGGDHTVALQTALANADDSARQAERRAGQLEDTLKQVAAFIIAGQRTSQHAEALDQIAAAILPHLQQLTGWHTITRCATCHGTGWTTLVTADNAGRTIECPTCWGSGDIDTHTIAAQKAVA